MFATLHVDPLTTTRPCQAVDAGHVHGTMPCNQAATIHCRRSGEDVCARHESGHATRTGCGQGEHDPVPLLVTAGAAA